MDDQQPDEDPKTTNTRHILTFFAILLVAVGEIYIYSSPTDDNITRLPISFWIYIGAIAAGVALFVISQALRPARPLLALFGESPFSGPTLTVTLALSLSLLALLLTFLLTKFGRTTYISALTLWLLAGLCYVAGFIRELPSPSAAREWLKKHRYELLAVGLVTLLAFALRFYQLGELPRVVNGDEGRVGLTAQSTNSDPYVNPFALWENFGALYLQSINLLLTAFGVSPFSLRLAAAIGGTLAIPALYTLARQIAGRRIALVAASLLAISHTHINFSRTIAVAYIQGTWLIPLELYFLLSGLQRRSSWRTALAGALLAIHFSIYLDSQIIAGLILVFMLIAFILLRSWFKPALPQALVFWGGFGIMILPEAAYSLQQPAAFFDRIVNNGSFQTGWLGETMQATHQSAFQILAQRVLHAFLSLFYYAPFDFYGSPVPTLTLISALLFILGLGIVLWKMRQPGFLLLNGYFWAGTLSIGLFAIPPSADTYRMLIVLPAALLMAAIGLDNLLQALGFSWTSKRYAYAAVTAVTVLALFIFNYWTYFYDFAGRCRYGSDSPPARFASYLGNYVRTIDKENTTYLLSNDTYFYGSHPSVDFLTGTHPITNVKEPVDTLQPQQDETIIANPDRIQELRSWADQHPGGKLQYQYDCNQTILLAYSFN